MTPPRYRDETWTHADLESRTSPIEGRGLFATRDMAAGEVVQVVGGIPMSDAEFASEASRRDRYNALQIGENLHLFDSHASGGGMNHACKGNCWMRDAVTVETRRNISRDEELTIDYALFTVIEGTFLPARCRCGDPACRGTPGGSDWQLAEVQALYHGHFSPFINERIRRTVSG